MGHKIEFQFVLNDKFGSFLVNGIYSVYTIFLKFLIALNHSTIN